MLSLSAPFFTPRPPLQNSSTCIWLRVSVPVLSEQITDTQPRLSTAFKSLMIACSFAICCVPIACTIVTIEPSASGIAATARATANINASRTGILRYRLNTKISAQIIRIPPASRLPKRSIESSRGVSFSCVSFIIPAIFPISVFIPVAVTTAIPRPAVTSDPENTILV